MPNITEMIYSNDYADYILPYANRDITSTYVEYGAQLLDSHYFLLHDNRQNPTFPIRSPYDIFNEYLFMPKLFVPLSIVSLEESGIIQAQIQPYLNLSGKGTILGFIDSGIDYTHKAFRTKDGNTRLLGIWDQTNPDLSQTVQNTFAQTDSDQMTTNNSSANPYHYGIIYNEEQINQALQSENPLSIVPVTDESGHGTALAGIAAGTPYPENDFTGAAFDAKLCVVKLKPAKQYLREYYFANENAILYQENDIMMGINYLISIAEKENKPLIICLGLGTNQGDHAGNSPVSKMITNRSYDTYTIFSIASGNEGNKAHHYFHQFSSAAFHANQPANNTNSQIDEIELLVPSGTSGFISEIWGSTNALYSIGFQSPLGTQIAPVTASPGKNDLISFVLEKTKIQLSYSIVPESGGDQLVILRFEQPVEGNWIIRVYNRGETNVSFHMWLPISNVLAADITFLKPDPETTLTVPSDADSSITTGFYNAYSNGIVAESGRGFTRDNLVKPNVITPGINVTAPSANNQFRPFSGSSAATALLAGGISQLQQWRLDSDIPSIINANSMNAYITRGAIRDNELNYPNPVSGYGKTNIYNVFQSLMS